MRNVKRRRARAPFWEPEPAIERTHGEKCTYFQGALCHTKGSIHSRVEWSETISRIRRGKGHRGKCSDSSRAASQIEVPIERPANHAHNASSWPPRVVSPRAGHNHHQQLSYPWVPTTSRAREATDGRPRGACNARSGASTQKVTIAR